MRQNDSPASAATLVFLACSTWFLAGKLKMETLSICFCSTQPRKWMNVLHRLICINSAVACVVHILIQMSWCSPSADATDQSSPVCLAVKPGRVTCWHSTNEFISTALGELSAPVEQCFNNSARGRWGERQSHRYRDSRNRDSLWYTTSC